MFLYFYKTYSIREKGANVTKNSLTATMIELNNISLKHKSFNNEEWCINFQNNKIKQKIYFILF